MEIMSNDLIKQIKRYQHCIQQINPVESDAHRVLHCIRKLSKLPIRLAELEKTGIGKTINALRKSDGSVAEEATLLVAKWKTIVKKQVEEEEALEQGSDVENHDQSDNESRRSSSPVGSDVQDDADFAPEPTASLAPKYEEESRNAPPRKTKDGGGGGAGGDQRSKYEEATAAASKVRLITIKKEGAHERKRKHSEEERADRSLKKEKYKKIADEEGSAHSKNHRREASVRESSHQQPLQQQHHHHHQEQQPPHHHHHQPQQQQQHKDKNGDVDEERRRESSSVGEKRKKEREGEKIKSHKKDHERRHHKSSKHKEEKSRREGKQQQQQQQQQQHRGDERDKHREKKHESEDKHNSHKHKRDKKSKTRDKDENHHSRKGDNRDRKSSRGESSETEVDSRKSSRDANSYRTAEIAGDDFGAALLGIQTTTSSPKKRGTSSSKSSINQDSPPTFSSPKSNNSLDFLSSNVKLEPLSKDLDISDVPDYVPEKYKASSRVTSNKPDERTSPSYYSPQPKPAKTKGLSEEDMFSSMVLMKNRRTKVYHGFKGNSKCPTLFELCVRVLQDNFDALEYTGGVPYEVLKPILEKVTVEQLYTFENYNPYLIGETDELWEHHAKKHFRKAERQEYETWRDLYLRCVEEREEKLQSLTENISQSIANSTPVRKTKLAYVDAVVKPPRNVARQQAKHGTGVSISAVKRSPKEPQPSQSAVQSVKERLAKEASSPNAIQIPTKAVKKKAAPLMQKTLQLFKGLKR